MILKNTKHMLVRNSLFKGKNAISQYSNGSNARILLK